MSGLSVDPAVGLPSGHPVLGSVTDGVSLPYSLDLGSATRARLVLSFDGTTVADVASAPATGTVTVPARQAALQRDDDVHVVLSALDPAGATITSAQTDGSIADGVILPATLTTFAQSGADLHPGDTLWVTEGETVRFQCAVDTGARRVPVAAYDLTVDGASILSDPSLSGQNGQWVAGQWTAPTGTSGNHTLRLSASAQGDSGVSAQTYTLSVQPTGSFALDSGSMTVDPAAALSVAGVLKRSTDYAVVPGAPVAVWWQSHDDPDWTQLATTTTDAQGRFAAQLNPTESGQYQLRSAGKPGTVGPTWSATVSVTVEAHVLLAVDRSTVSTGNSLTFTVRAPSTLQGVSAMLQLWNGTYWTTVAHTPIDDRGQATLGYQPDLSGTYRFGALTGYSAAFAPTASDDLTVTVR